MMPKKIKPRSALAVKRYLRQQYQNRMAGKPVIEPGESNWWDGSTDEIERIYDFMFGESILEWYTEWHTRLVDRQEVK